MLYIAVACLLAWAIPRRAGHGWAIATLLLVAVVSSSLVVNDVRTSGVVRDDTNPDYSIVYYNTTALFPFVVQKHHNWTARTFSYRLLLLSQDGAVVFRSGALADQSEYMHWTLFEISVMACFMGFFVTAWVIVCAEFIWWWRRTPHTELQAVQSSGM